MVDRAAARCTRSSKTPAVALEGVARRLAAPDHRPSAATRTTCSTKATPRAFVEPATAGVEPIADKMNNWILEQGTRTDACNTGQLQGEVVDGPAQLRNGEQLMTRQTRRQGRADHRRGQRDGPRRGRALRRAKARASSSATSSTTPGNDDGRRGARRGRRRHVRARRRRRVGRLRGDGRGRDRHLRRAARALQQRRHLSRRRRRRARHARRRRGDAVMEINLEGRVARLPGRHPGDDRVGRRRDRQRRVVRRAHGRGDRADRVHREQGRRARR